MLDTIPENIKIIITSAAPLTIVLILFLITGSFGIGKVTDLRSQVDTASSQQNTLNQKLNILQTVSPSLSSSSNLATTALPSDNAAILTISQLKFLASTNSVTLSGTKSGAAVIDSTGLSRVDITFDVTGTRPQVITFLKSISTIAPISVVDNIKLNENSGVTRATTTVRAFWSPLPAKLPPVTTALTDLTQDEKDTLNSISALVQPVFLTLPPAGGGGKADPFAP